MANPSTLISQFTDSLAFTDSSGAGVWTPTDPIIYNNGLLLESAITNYSRDSSFELSGAALAAGSKWSMISGTITGVSTHAYSGTYSCQFEVTTAAYAGVFGTTNNRPAATEGEAWTVSAWMRSDHGMSVKPQISWYTGAAGTGSLISTIGTTTFSLTTNWQRVSVSGVAPATTASFIPSFYDQGGTAVGETYHIDAVQMEKNPSATSYADGSLGDGYAFTGASHNSTSTRAASSVSVDQDGANRIDPASGSIAFRYTRKIDTAAEEIILTSGVVGAGTDYLELGIDSTDHFYAEWNSNNAGANRVTSTGTVSVDIEYFLYTDWDGNAIRVSIDNGAFDSDTRDAVEGDWSTGDLTLSAATGSYVVGPFLVGDRVLTSKEIARLYGKETWSLTTLRPINQRMTNFQLRPKAA